MSRRRSTSAFSPPSPASTTRPRTTRPARCWAGSRPIPAGSRTSRTATTSAEALARDERSLDHVAQDLDHLLGLARDGERGAVDLLERVVVLARVQRHERLAQSGGVAGVEGRVPLAGLLAQTHAHPLGVVDQRAGAGPGA